MSPSLKALTLPATPRAVQLAREWVAKVLTDIDRAELVESAELGVSELVTNAIIHSAPPVAVRVRGTRAHPRIEVADRSLVPPQPVEELGEEEEVLLTFGRGLALVALHSAAWGSDVDPDGHGKTVWFEPLGEPREKTNLTGVLFDFEEEMERREFSLEPEATMPVALIGMPVVAFADLRRHYGELSRELRLLSLSAPDRYPLATELSAVALQVEQERRQSRGLEALAEAEAEGRRTVDLHYLVPVTAPGTMGRLAELLEQAQVFFDNESLLSLRPTPLIKQLQEWYLGEFVRQGAGHPPSPWAGGYPDQGA